LAQLFPALEMQAQILHEFVQQHLHDSAELQDHLAAGAAAAAQLAQCAHRMKGASRMVGALALADVCLRIEQAAKRNDLATAAVLIETELPHTNTQFAAWVSRYARAS